MFIEDGAEPKAAESLLCLRYFRRSSLPHHQSHLWTTFALPEQLSISQHHPPGPGGPPVAASAGEQGASFSIPACAVCLRFLPHGQLDLFLGIDLCCFPCQ